MSHSGASPGDLGQAGQAAAWLAQGLAALDDRLLKARSEQFTVKAAGDLAFTVQNGDGVDYAVEFKTVRTGTCTCPDFAQRGRNLGTCKHLLRAVVVNWPERLESYLELVRAHIRQTVERHASKNGSARSGSGGDQADVAHQTDPPAASAPQLESDDAVARAGEAPVLASPVTQLPPPGDDQLDVRCSQTSHADGLVQAAVEAMLDATMRVVQETIPEIAQRMVEELFARLMERAPELFEEALREARAAQDAPREAEAEA